MSEIVGRWLPGWEERFAAELAAADGRCFVLAKAAAEVMDLLEQAKLFGACGAGWDAVNEANKRLDALLGREGG